jgi:protein kinase A
MEFINGPNFYEFESILPALTADQGAFYIGQIVLILEYLHMNMILYRDLKPENLMVQKDGYLKLVDFGCAKKLKGHFSKTFTLCGSPEFQAPEIVLNKGHGFPADYWALGIFIYELFAYQSPFFNENPMVHYKNIIRGNFSFPRLFPKKAMDLVTELLVKDPKKRNFKIFDGFNKIKANNFFNNLNWQKLRTKELVAPYFPKKYDLKEIEPYMVVPNANNKNNIKFTIDNYKNW